MNVIVVHERGRWNYSITIVFPFQIRFPPTFKTSAILQSPLVWKSKISTNPKALITQFPNAFGALRKLKYLAQRYSGRRCIIQHRLRPTITPISRNKPVEVHRFLIFLMRFSISMSLFLCVSWNFWLSVAWKNVTWAAFICL